MRARLLGATALVVATAATALPPGPPFYLMRPEVSAGDRLKPGGEGKVLFEVRCGYCHLVGGIGTNLLTKQRMMMGETPDKSLLANRTGLSADYVKSVVCMGKDAMPGQTKVDVTDAELEAVAKCLGKAGCCAGAWRRADRALTLK